MPTPPLRLLGGGVVSDTIIRKRSFAQVPDALVIDTRLSHLAVRLWVRLDKYAGADGNAFPSRARLAADLGVSRGGIARALSELAANGWVSRHPRDDRPGGSWTTILHDECQHPSQDTSDPDSHMSRPQPTSETTPTHMRDPEGYPPTDTHQGDWSDDAGSSSDARGIAHPAARPKRRGRKGKPPETGLLDGDQDDYNALRAICEEIGEDDPMSVWWTLRKAPHHAWQPSRLLKKLVDDGVWDGFAGSHGIDEYNADGTAA